MQRELIFEHIRKAPELLSYYSLTKNIFFPPAFKRVGSDVQQR